MPRHPNQVLFEGEKPFPIIPTCEHFAGTEERITKALELQNKMGGVFDITMDCEDGAPMGAEREHAEMVVRMQNSATNQHNMSESHPRLHERKLEGTSTSRGGAGARLSYITIRRP